jgi:fumarate reductase subunit C
MSTYMLILISLMFVVLFLIILCYGIRSLTAKPKWEKDIEEYLKVHEVHY